MLKKSIFNIAFLLIAVNMVYGREIKPLQTLIAKADSLQAAEKFEYAIVFFEEAADICNHTVGYYSYESRYIHGSISTCAILLGDRDKSIAELIRLDEICRQIGYDDDLGSEMVICYNLAEQLVTYKSSVDEISQGRNYIQRGMALVPPDDGNSQKAFEFLQYYCNSISASQMDDLNDSAPVLKKSYDFFYSQEILAAAGHSDGVLISGLIWASNLIMRNENEEGLSVLVQIERQLNEIEDSQFSFAWWEMQTLRLKALFNKGSYAELIAFSNHILDICGDVNENNFQYILNLKIIMAQAYNESSRFADAKSCIDDIRNNEFYVAAGKELWDVLEAAEALSLYGQGEIESAYAKCKAMFSTTIDRKVLQDVTYLMSQIEASRKSNAQVGYMDDMMYFIEADNLEDDILLPETYVVYAKRYANYGQYWSAMKTIDKAIKIYQQNGQEKTYEYIDAMMFRYQTMLNYSDDACFEFFEFYRNEENTIAELAHSIQQNGEYARAGEMLLSMFNIFSVSIDKTVYYCDKAFMDGEATEQQIAEVHKELKHLQEKILDIMSMLDEKVYDWLQKNEPNLLGMLYHSCARTFRSIKNCERGLIFLDEVLMKLDKNSEMYDVLEDLRILMELELGRYEQNREYIVKRFNEDREHYRHDANMFSAAQRRQWISRLHNTMTDYVAYAYESNLDWLKELAYDAILISKGLLLQVDIDFEQAVSRSTNEQLKSEFAKWKELSVGNPQEAANIERNLLRQLGADRENTAFKYSWKDVANALIEDEYAIEFFTINTGGMNRYLAFVIGPDYKSPQCYDICSDTDFKFVGKGENTDFSLLSKLIWQKFNGVIPRGATIVFSPHYELNSYPLENLPDYLNGDELISDRWNLKRVTSTREIVNRQYYRSDIHIELMGGFEYSMDSTELINDYEINKTRYHKRSATTDDIRATMTYVMDLPGALMEVEEIAQLAKEKSIKTTEITGSKGTESYFKAEAGKNGNVMHISTHGFYYAPYTEDGGIIKDVIFKGSQQLDNYETALCCSGLMMAGVNEVLEGRVSLSQCEDGILTAKEISMMDLSNIRTVVLSACDTGVGQISGDGIVGLQRGFKMAGVQTIMMSLWKVDDEATAMLMTEFYRHWLSGMDIVASLAKAQTVVRNVQGWENPYFWASFVLVDAI